MLFLRLEAAIVAAALFAAGCDSGPPVGKVHGKVTYKGSPVTTGTIYFHPKSGGEAFGRIQPDGSYTMKTRDSGVGLPTGEYQVTIEAHQTQGGGGSYLDENGLPVVPAARVRIKQLVPQEYSSTSSSGLTANVAKGDNEIDFALP